jgi:hypothetical protein
MVFFTNLTGGAFNTRAARVPISTIRRSENRVVAGKTPPYPKTASHLQNTAGLRRR